MLLVNTWAKHCPCGSLLHVSFTDVMNSFLTPQKKIKPQLAFASLLKGHSSACVCLSVCPHRLYVSKILRTSVIHPPCKYLKTACVDKSAAKAPSSEERCRQGKTQVIFFSLYFLYNVYFFIIIFIMEKQTGEAEDEKQQKKTDLDEGA